jgi:CheY-like chemotaxis protein
MNPAVEEQKSKRKHLGVQEVPIEQSQKDLILLVDDEPMMQELGRDILLEQGYRVLLAADGVEAVELYKKNSKEIKLVILDLLMPRLDGGQTYLKMKEINNNVKAFFCSGYALDEMLGTSIVAESLRALQKPFRPSEFVRTVREVLAAF